MEKPTEKGVEERLYHNRRKSFTQEHRNKISKGRKRWYKIHGFPEEIKRKISKTKKKRYRSGELVPWNKGKKRPPFSKKWRENISKSLKKKHIKKSRYFISQLIKRNKINNPMWNSETVKKAVLKRDYKKISCKGVETKRKNGIFLEYSKRMKENNPMKDPEINKKVNQNPEVIKKRISSLIKKPNQKEIILIKILKKHGFPYKYVGDGQKIIGNKNPDFIDVNRKKKIIELFGDYWHTKRVRTWEETKEGRINYFKRYGYDTLIIWENELNDPNLILEKIKTFNRR